MNNCEQIKQQLLKHGRDSIERHQRLRMHLGECESCRRLLDSWARIPGLLEDLPEHEPPEALLQTIESAVLDSTEKRTPNPHGMPRLATSLASAAVLLAAIGLSLQLLDHEYPRDYPSLNTPVLKEEYEIAFGQQRDSQWPYAESVNRQANKEPADPRLIEQQVGDVAASLGEGHAQIDRSSEDRNEMPALRNNRIFFQTPEEEKGQLDAGLSSVDGPVSTAGALQAERYPASEPIGEMGSDEVSGPEGRERQLFDKMDADGSGRTQTDNFGFETDTEESLDDLRSKTGHPNDEATEQALYRDSISRSERESQAQEGVQRDFIRSKTQEARACSSPQVKS